jgi:hypothetical protein
MSAGDCAAAVDVAAARLSGTSAAGEFADFLAMRG